MMLDDPAQSSNPTLYAAVEEATLLTMDFNQELMCAGEVICMITGVFQPEEQE